MNAGPRYSVNLQCTVSHNKVFYRFKTLECRYIDEGDSREIQDQTVDVDRRDRDVGRQFWVPVHLDWEIWVVYGLVKILHAAFWSVNWWLSQFKASLDQEECKFCHCFLITEEQLSSSLLLDWLHLVPFLNINIKHIIKKYNKQYENRI